jgi:alpha-methylacyl-CoA racemase
MIQGAALLAAPFWGYRESGFWQERGTNLLDGAAPHYDVYETADGGYVSFGAIEPRFYAKMTSLIGLEEDGHGPLADQNDRSQWPAMKKRVAAIVRTKTRDEWCALLEGTDACFAPVLPFEEAPTHPHIAGNGVFTEVEGLTQPSPAPRFSRTPSAIQGPPSQAGQHTRQALIDWGFGHGDVNALFDLGVVAGQPPTS